MQVTSDTTRNRAGRPLRWRARQPEAFAAAGACLVGIVVGVVVAAGFAALLRALYGRSGGEPLRTVAIIVANVCIVAPVVAAAYAFLRPRGEWGRGDSWRVVVAILAAGFMEDAVGLPLWAQVLMCSKQPALVASREGVGILVYMVLAVFGLCGVYVFTRRPEAGELGPHCRRCGLDLTGAKGAQCPRCGERLWRGHAIRPLKLAATILLVALLLGWAASAFASLSWRSMSLEMGVGSQMAWFFYGPAVARLNPKGWCLEFAQWDCGTMPRIRNGAGSQLWFIPLWIPAVLLGLATNYLCRRCRHIPPGHCWRCAYDLTGNTSGACPECGERISNGAFQVCDL